MDQINDFLDAISPYLPNSLASTLSTVVNSLPDPTSLSLSSLVPFALSLLTLYFTLLSVYSTARFFLRTAFLAVKYGLVAATVAAAYQGATSGTAGWWDSAKGVGQAAGSAYGTGKRGLDSWAGMRSGGSRAKRSSNGRSASGKRKTWATPDENGEWNDPFEEADLQDPVKFVKDRVLTFLSNPGTGSADKTQGGNARKAKGKGVKGKVKAKEESGGFDLSGMAMRYAMGRATKVWEDISGTGRQAETEKDNGRKR
ncbi:hypothetical protein P7C70_g4330, partial [Phenoliferia sp. Uapishka_3]